MHERDQRPHPLPRHRRDAAVVIDVVTTVVTHVVTSVVTSRARTLAPEPRR